MESEGGERCVLVPGGTLGRTNIVVFLRNKLYGVAGLTVRT